MCFRVKQRDVAEFGTFMQLAKHKPIRWIVINQEIDPDLNYVKKLHGLRSVYLLKHNAKLSGLKCILKLYSGIICLYVRGYSLNPLNKF